VFQYRGSRILVDGNVEKKVVDIAVANGGENRRAALHVMRHHFDKVHRLNPEAKPEALVPAPDDPEIEASYAQLLLMEKQQGPDFEFYPRGSERPYRVGDLLDGVGRNLLDALGDPKKPSSGERSHPPASKSKDEVSEFKDDLFRWGIISLGTGLGAVAAVVLVSLLPSNLQFPIGGLLALFGAVSAFMFFRNPAWFYKRWIGISMTTGLFWSALGAYLEISYGDTPLLKWKVVADPWIYALVGVAIVVFTWADVKLQLAQNARRP
jgi:hypothetical protein